MNLFPEVSSVVGDNWLNMQGNAFSFIVIPLCNVTGVEHHISYNISGNGVFSPISLLCTSVSHFCSELEVGNEALDIWIASPSAVIRSPVVCEMKKPLTLSSMCPIAPMPKWSLNVYSLISYFV